MSIGVVGQPGDPPPNGPGFVPLSKHHADIRTASVPIPALHFYQSFSFVENQTGICPVFIGTIVAQPQRFSRFVRR